ncbi:hypothetical protein A7976_13530 [Methylobacillus sp. MM3]|nr:hypothetical protein A7976_13530 [Methylobacillus sp. MM3]
MNTRSPNLVVPQPGQRPPLPGFLLADALGLFVRAAAFAGSRFHFRLMRFKPIKDVGFKPKQSARTGHADGWGKPVRAADKSRVDREGGQAEQFCEFGAV